MAIAAVAGIMASLNAALQISKSMLTVRDMVLLQESLIELNGEIIRAQEHAISANQTQATLVNEKRDLEKQISDMKIWETEKEKHALKELPRGIFVFCVKESANSSDPIHFLCPNCYEDSRKSILQPEIRTPGMSQVLVCHRCNFEVYTAGLKHPDHQKPPRRK